MNEKTGEEKTEKVHTVQYVVSEEQTSRNLLSDSNQAVEEKREERNEEGKGKRLVSMEMKTIKEHHGGTQSVPKQGRTKQSFHIFLDLSSLSRDSN